MSQDTKLAALIGSRICHDLISPIGAINNGLELLGMTGVSNSPELDLIAESVGNASARIRFFRVAFGASSQQEIGAAEADQIIQSAMGAGRLTVEYKVATGRPRGEVRLVFLALLCLEDAMPYGGEITVEHDGSDWHLLGRSGKINVDQEVWSLLGNSNTINGLEPSHVQFALFPAVIRESGMTLNTDIGDDSISIMFG